MNRLEPIEADQPRRAMPVPVVLALTLGWGLAVLLAFDSDIQTVGADELVSRSDDAQAFLTADYVLIVLYALVLPLAMWRFGTALGQQRPPPYIQVGAALLFAAGLIDVAENALLQSATGSLARGTVDTAHALLAPKVALLAGGLGLALAAAAGAVLLLRESRPA